MTSSILVATPTGPDPWTATAEFRGQRFRASIGRNGLVAADAKREGDGKSPIGIWPMRSLFFQIGRAHV